MPDIRSEEAGAGAGQGRGWEDIVVMEEGRGEI